MKEIIREHTHIEKYIVYQAVDGTEFREKEECIKYDNSARGILRGRVKDYIVGEPTDAWILMGGCADLTIVAFRLPTEKAVDTFLKFLFLECPWYLDDNWKSRKAEVEDIIYKAYENKDVVLMGESGEDASYLFINSRQNIIDNLNNIDKKKDE